MSPDFFVLLGIFVLVVGGTGIGLYLVVGALLRLGLRLWLAFNHWIAPDLRKKRPHEF